MNRILRSIAFACTTIWSVAGIAATQVEDVLPITHPYQAGFVLPATHDYGSPQPIVYVGKAPKLGARTLILNVNCELTAPGNATFGIHEAFLNGSSTGAAPNPMLLPSFYYNINPAYTPLPQPSAFGFTAGINAAIYAWFEGGDEPQVSIVANTNIPGDSLSVFCNLSGYYY
jgi:hypothetical protein